MSDAPYLMLDARRSTLGARRSTLDAQRSTLDARAPILHTRQPPQYPTTRYPAAQQLRPPTPDGPFLRLSSPAARLPGCPAAPAARSPIAR